MNKPTSFTRSIVVRTQFEGLHRWAEAPESVAFLRAYHRHIFSIKVKIAVAHADRAIEFFTVLQKVRAALNDFRMSSHCSIVPGSNFLVRFDLSCEALAAYLGDSLLDRDLPVVSVEVSEDGENSGLVEYDYTRLP